MEKVFKKKKKKKKSLANSVLNWILTDQVLVSVTMETANLGGHFGGGKKSGELKRYRYH